MVGRARESNGARVRRTSSYADREGTWHLATAIAAAIEIAMGTRCGVQTAITFGIASPSNRAPRENAAKAAAHPSHVTVATIPARRKRESRSAIMTADKTSSGSEK